MLRVRFHARGGQGVKTASRILGTAAFGQDWQVQDFPVYGAERRGAPVAAFTRIDRAPILERGLIVRPDYLVIGDETLLEDPAAGVLQGQESVGGVFVNSACPAATLAERYHLPGTVQALDLFAMAGMFAQISLPANVAKEAAGRQSPTTPRAPGAHLPNLSAALGAAACALTGLLSVAALERGVREELASLGLHPEEIDGNVALARQVFAQLAAVPLQQQPCAEAEVLLHPPRYQEGPQGVPIIFAAGNSYLRHTGTWRTFRPVIDLVACTRCLLCLVRCPEGAIALDTKGYPHIDYDHCKGCLICAQECPLRCVREEKEVRA